MCASTKRRLVRRGAAAVEFALLLPLLVTLVLGCVDFGRFAYTYIAVTNAARAAADFGSRNSYSYTTRNLWRERIQQAALDEMGTPFEPQHDAIQVSVSILTTDGSKRVQVRVTCPFETVVNWPFLPHHETLARTVQMPVIQ